MPAETPEVGIAAVFKGGKFVAGIKQAWGVLSKFTGTISQGVKKAAAWTKETIRSKVGTDLLSRSFIDGLKQGKRFLGLFGRKEEKTFLKGLEGVGAGVLGVARSTEDLKEGFSDLIGGIPVFGRFFVGMGKVVAAVVRNLKELEAAVTKTGVQLLGVSRKTQTFESRMREISKQFGIGEVEAIELAKSLGDVEEGEDRVQKLTGTLTEETVRLFRAFDMAPEEAANLMLMRKAFRVTGEDLEELGGRVLDFQRRFRIPDLLQEIPEIAEMTRRSALQLGRSFDTVLTPAVLNTGRVVAVLRDRLGISRKEGAKLAKEMIKQFQDMAFNIDAVFHGVEEDFDARTQSILELFVVAGRDAASAFEAIGKAAQGDFRDIGQAFVEVTKKNMFMGRHFGIKLMQQYGTELPKVLETFGDEAKAMYQELFGPLKKGPEAIEDFRKSQEVLLKTFEKLGDRFEQLLNAILTAFGISAPELQEETKEIFDSLLNLGSMGEKKIGDVAQEVSRKLGPAIQKVRMSVIEPLLERLEEWLAETDLKKIVDNVVKNLKEAAEVLKAAIQTVRGVLVSLGVVAESEEEKVRRMIKETEEKLLKIRAERPDFMKGTPAGAFLGPVAPLSPRAIEEAEKARKEREKALEAELEYLVKRYKELRALERETYLTPEERVREARRQRVVVEVKGNAEVKGDLSGEMKGQIKVRQVDSKYGTVPTP